MPRTPRRPRPTLILFVRHGQTATTGQLLPGRAPGLHLADAGKAQAHAAADAIATLSKVDAIYSSPLERARETAAPIAAARGLKVKIDRGLLDLDVLDHRGRLWRARPDGADRELGAVAAVGQAVMSTSFEIDVDLLTTGTVGPPGQRVFYLQARQGNRVLSLRLEKTQVAALC